MKPFYSRLCLVALISVCAVFAQAQSIFTSSYHLPTFNNLNKIAWADANNMYAIGDGGVFVKTNDGGTTFTTTFVSQQNEALNGCDFSSAQVGAVCGDNGLVGFTTNGGATWLTSRIPGSLKCVDVKFDVLTGTGFVADIFGIYRTTNAGLSWDHVMSVPYDMNDQEHDTLFSVLRVSPTTFLAFDDFATTYQSTDAGQHWDSIGNSKILHPSAITFLDAKNGWVAAGQYLARTTNGGRTWPDTLADVATWGLPTISGLIIKDASADVTQSHGWALGYQYSGGGVSAFIDSVYAKGYLLAGKLDYCVNKYFPRANIGVGAVPARGFAMDPSLAWGWIICAGGEIFKMSKPGQDSLWKSLTSGNPSHVGPVTASSFFDENTGVICTYLGNNQGHLYGTTNAGQTWPMSGGSGENADYCVRMVDQLHAVGLYQNSSNYSQYTSDGGAHWAGCSPFPTGLLAIKRICQVNATVLFACGQQGLVIKSSDGGKGWNNSPMITDPDLSSINYGGVAFADPTHGFVCGGNGTLVKTANAGSSWTKVDLSNQAENTTFTDISFASATSVWMTSDSDGVAFHSNDGGATWQPQDIGAHGVLSRVVFATAQMGWISGQDGQLYMTQNDGATWQSIPTGTQNTITDISPVPRTGTPTHLWISGGYSMVLNGDLSQVGVAQENLTAAPSTMDIASVYPNPFASRSNNISVQFTTAAHASAKLEIVNALGEVVRTITKGAMNGQYTATWDGLMDSGVRASAGVYFFSLSTGNSRVTKSFVVTR